MRLKTFRPTARSPRARLLALATTIGGVAVLFGLNGFPENLAFFDGSPAASEAAALSSSPDARFECVVDYVNDGDTLRCKDGTRVRLHAVAAREADESCAPGHPCPAATGASATAALSRFAVGKTVRCEPTGRSFNRVTAICWTPAGDELNCAMVRSGTTLIWDKFDRQSPICRR